MRRVDPRVYTKDYYLEMCTGFDVFAKKNGFELEQRLKTIVRRIPDLKDKIILDVGCGRGEMVYWMAKNGASKVIGIDYSTNAIEIANSSRKKWPKDVRKIADFKVMDAKKIKFKAKTFDAVISTETFEHLYEEEQLMVLENIYSILKDDGFVFVHTSPAKFFSIYTYKYWCYPLSTILVWINNLIKRSNYANIMKPSLLRTKYHKIVHVNEPNYFTLRKLIKTSGFKGNVYSTNTTFTKSISGWKDWLFNFIVFLDPISRFPPFNIIWGNDYCFILKKK